MRLDTGLESLIEHMGADQGARVLASVVTTVGSTYCKPGARMLILADGSCHGLLSGGCLEADLALHARQVLTSGIARAIEYDMRGPDDILFGIGAGCEGAMRVLLEPAGPGTLAEAALNAAANATRSGRSTSLAAVYESTTLPLGTYGVEADLPADLLAAAQRGVEEARSRDLRFGLGGNGGRAFIQFLAPPPHLLVCGAGPDAQPVVNAALTLGWRVTWVDHRPAYATTQQIPAAPIRQVEPQNLCTVVDIERTHAVVVMSHHLASDVAYLRALAHAGVPDFVGLLGPRARRMRVLQELGNDAVQLQARIRGPVGIDIGAVTPQGIALSIVSQVHAWLAYRQESDVALKQRIPT